VRISVPAGKNFSATFNGLVDDAASVAAKIKHERSDALMFEFREGRVELVRCRVVESLRKIDIADTRPKKI
jgi:hypothetical protein